MAQSKEQKAQAARARKYDHYVKHVLPQLLKYSPVAVGWEDTVERVKAWIEMFRVAKKAAHEAGCPINGHPTVWSSCSMWSTWDHVQSLIRVKGYMHDWVVEAWGNVEGMDFQIDGFDRIEQSRRFMELIMAAMPKDQIYSSDGVR